MKQYGGLFFLKFSATGNDFILIDNRNLGLSEKDREFFSQICQRRISVGADGVLLIESHPEYDFRLRYFNADGSEAECGNGARAAAYFFVNSFLNRPHTSFLFGKNVYEAEVSGNRVKLKMPRPKDLRESVDVLEEDFLEEGGFINTGVPHFVLFGQSVFEIDVLTLGRKYRNHPYFQPDAANVDFVEIVSRNEIVVRTYERGVEDETLSCGTGCVAAAILANLKKQTIFPTKIVTHGGMLQVHKNGDDFFLEGEVKLVYEGKLHSI